jgi:hypothetical protein
VLCFQTAVGLHRRLYDAPILRIKGFSTYQNHSDAWQEFEFFDTFRFASVCKCLSKFNLVFVSTIEGCLGMNKKLLIRQYLFHG